jgi:predicted PurR-regulated permease PerM
VDRGILVDNITELVQDRATAIANSIPDTVQRVVRSISSLIQFITIGAITPVLFYYTLLDYDAITARMIELFPRVRGSRSYLDVAGRVVGRYLRGQLTISAIAAVLVTIALTIFGVPFALVIGMLAGILNMIPNIGIVITQVIGILLALLFGEPGLVKALIVFLVLLGESLLEQSVLTPKIQGRKVGLHPVLILLSLFVFGSLMGLFGLLIAVPATALLVTAYGHWRHELTLDLGARQSQGALDRLLNWRSRAPGDRPSGAHPMRSQPDTMRAQALAGSGEVGEPGEPPPDMPDQAATGDVEEQL